MFDEDSYRNNKLNSYLDEQDEEYLQEQEDRENAKWDKADADYEQMRDER